MNAQAPIDTTTTRQQGNEATWQRGEPMGRQLAIDNRQLAIGSRETEVGSRQSAIGNRETANGKREKPNLRSWNLKLETCNRQLVTGNWQPASGNRKRTWLIAGIHVAGWTASYIALNKAWYADYPKSDFHFFNDNGEWNQMDKTGHIWTAYQVSRISAGLWQWSGVSDRKSAWLGGISGLAYQSIIEIQDGFSSEWGFSWGDMAANTLGAATFVAQQLAWKEQRLQIKLSYWPYDYNSPELVTRRNQLFGKSLPERMLKDYNSQTYWLSANVFAFLPNSKWPAWLNMAVGYNSNGMLGGYENKWTDKQGNTFYRYDIPRERHFLLSPDIDLTRIKTNKKWLRTVLSVANMVKIPAPAVALSSKGKIKLYGLYY